MTYETLNRDRAKALLQNGAEIIIKKSEWSYDNVKDLSYTAKKFGGKLTVIDED